MLEDPVVRTQAIFGDPVDGKTRVCSSHKREDDVNLVSSMCEVCMLEDPVVRTRASFGNPIDGRPLHCSHHKRVGDVDVRHK